MPLLEWLAWICSALRCASHDMHISAPVLGSCTVFASGHAGRSLASPAL